MPSNIDASKPITGNPTTQSVRDQFATAKSEISAIQAAMLSLDAYTKAQTDDKLLLITQNLQSAVGGFQLETVNIRNELAAGDATTTTIAAAANLLLQQDYQTKITQEAQARSAADTDLGNDYTTQISQEITARTAAVSNEAAARINADTVLQGTIATTQSTLNAADTTIISALLDHSPILINGSMRIAQRAVNFAAVTDLTYTLDRWQYRKNGSMIHTINQDTDAPSVAQAGCKLTNSLAITLTTAQATLTAGQFATIRQLIEGSRYQRIAHRPHTLSFWVKCSATTRISVILRNADASQNYASPVQIAATNTWQRVAVNVTPAPEAGAWNYTNNAGLELAFSLGSAANLKIAPNAWTSTQAYGSTDDTVNLATVNQILKITAVRIQPGTTDHQFELPTLDIERLNCQRYYWHTFQPGTLPAQNAGVLGTLQYWQTVAGIGPHQIALTHPITMRAPPSAVFFNPSAANASWRSQTRAADSGAAALLDAATNNCIISNAGLAADTAKSQHRIHASFTAEL